MSSHKIRSAENVDHYIGMESDGALCIGMESGGALCIGMARSMDTMEKSCVGSKRKDTTRRAGSLCLSRLWMGPMYML